MQERSSITKRSHDLNQLAANLVEEANNEQSTEQEIMPGKNPHAAALGRLGGKKGGPARAVKLSAERRTEIARKAAETRWHNKRRSQEGE